ncbi:MAG TPA: HAMP domain-containing sensor histidine kinase, partial [Vicinamibacterales bacterium]|nr:HAMP domain-containing sensor histidine kinase [Vicinamibacterales bacterium]
MRPGARSPLVFAVPALVGAAALVIWLEHRAITALERQADAILRQAAEQAAAALAARARQLFDGPVFDTLTAVNHPLLRENRLDLVAHHYRRGLREYPHVERFFVWTVGTDAYAPDEVLFFRGESAGGALAPAPARPPVAEGTSGVWARDPPLGRIIHGLARQHAAAQQIYVGAEHALADGPRQIFIRIFWNDARRETFFALLGFTVHVRDGPRRAFARLVDPRRQLVPAPDPGLPPLRAALLDERGRLVGGASPLAPLARRPLVIAFYPYTGIHSRLAAQAPARVWTLTVGPAGPRPGTSARLQAYGLSAASVLLMLLGLALVIRADRQARRLAKMQADFVSHVSHQLKTPLSVLSGMVETLTLGRVRSDAQRREYLEMMRIETSRLNALVRGILDLARVEGGGRRYEPEAIDLARLAREAAEDVRRSHPGEAVEVAVEAPDHGPVVTADPAALEQALLNLLDNAVKYSPGEKAIRLAVRASTADAVIEVRDHGVGIPADEQPHVFERFFRGRAAGRHHQGFGLGLAIVRELVAAQGGRVELESRVGEGSTFRIVLPLTGGRRRGRLSWSALAARWRARPQPASGAA